jgi:ABC-type siderophore export system fused ATPase/permease subunit
MMSAAYRGGGRLSTHILCLQGIGQCPALPHLHPQRVSDTRRSSEAPVRIVRGPFAGLVAIINTAIHSSGPSTRRLAFGFCGFLVGRTLANATARLLLNQFTQETLSGLALNLSRKLLATPLGELERIGIPRILATLTHDVAMLGWAAQNLPSLATNVAVIAGCAIYLGGFRPRP